MLTRTKIVCTIGPAVESEEMMLELLQAGMNVARLNFSHGSHSTHGETIARLKSARKKLGKPLAIMLDTRGPEVRLRQLKDGPITLTAGQKLWVLKENVLGDAEGISITPPDVLDGLGKGTRILFDDGYISSHVVTKDDRGVLVEIHNDGVLKAGKGVNIPNEKLNLPAMTDQDRADIVFGCEQDVDIIAASFVRTADDVVAIKKLVDEQGRTNILVIAKIENAEGVQNLDNIVQVADGIMIARGDLGVEVPISQVPRLQKMMIRKCYLAGKPSVTATQMLESMIQHPRPTRAEVSDVANAIFDSTSAVMLSGETAIGKHPIETVRVMRSIIREAEADFPYQQFLEYHSNKIYHDVPSSVTLATVKTAYSAHAKVIFAFTRSGSTARLLSRLRPEMPIIAMTPNEKSYNQLAFNWGVIPVHCATSNDFDEAYRSISRYALDHHYVSYGDLVIVTAGSPFGVSGTTNTMIVENIGDVLVRGLAGVGVRVHGNVTVVLSADSSEPFMVRNQILVVTKCDPTYLPLLRDAAAIVLHNHVDDAKSEGYLLEMAKKYDKSVVVRAEGAISILSEGQLVTVDPEKGLVYKGVVL